jgi:hypothetical protein
MTLDAAASPRGRCLSPDPPVSPGFLRSAQTLAIRRAARDAHRSLCDHDSVECSVCREHARMIADAKLALNRSSS